MLPHQSGPAAATTFGSSIVTIRSGFGLCHAVMSGNGLLGGMSAGFPRGAPASTHLLMVATSSSVSEMSFLKLLMPMVRSMNHGGISRDSGFVLIERAHGLPSS